MKKEEDKMMAVPFEGEGKLTLKGGLIFAKILSDCLIIY